MRILADENIPFAREAFGALAPDAVVTTASGRAIGPADLPGVDCLMVRSVTQVNAALLARADRLKFVGTCTIGTDHVDQNELRRRNIPFASAPGSNADSVWEWFASTVLTLAERGGFDLAGKTLGVVGCGNVGERIARRAEAIFGLRVLRNDPPLAEQQRPGAPAYCSLDQLCAEADIITCHTPLERGGPHPTFHLFDGTRLARLRPGTLLINAGRGEVLHAAGLLDAIRGGRIGPVALDVWDREPAIDRDLLAAVAIGTPHIAGYSFNGKVNATEMIYGAACEALQRPAVWSAESLLTPPPDADILVAVAASSPAGALLAALRQVYDVRADDADLRGALGVAPAETGPYFDRLRKNYRRRRECRDFRLTFPPGWSPVAAWLDPLRRMGFQLPAASLPRP
ncbi:MAG: 4-phosphoerythronate dehydrogenase [Planctomycetota bacterium]